jgi:hypothetical protein
VGRRAGAAFGGLEGAQVRGQRARRRYDGVGGMRGEVGDERRSQLLICTRGYPDRSGGVKVGNISRDFRILR